MKKKVNFALLFLSILLFAILYVYTETSLINSDGYFSYHVSDFVGYVSLWSITIFILSLLAFKLDIEKYKIWLKTSLVISAFSIFLAYMAGSGNGAIVDINGELVTWFFTGAYSFLSIIYFVVQFAKNRKIHNSN